MPNPYAQLRALLPEPPLQVGTVSSSDGSRATLTLPDGSTAQARGAAPPGQRVFFRNGVIEGNAPLLPVVVIEV